MKEHLLLTISFGEAGAREARTSEEILIDLASTPDSYKAEISSTCFSQNCKDKIDEYRLEGTTLS